VGLESVRLTGLRFISVQDWAGRPCAWRWVLQVAGIELSTVCCKHTGGLVWGRWAGAMLFPPLQRGRRGWPPLRRCPGCSKPVGDIDYRALLAELWNRQQGEGRGDVVAYSQVWRSKWRSLDFDDFQRRLVALEGMVGGLLSV
jgi:hypothetical protein